MISYSITIIAAIIIRRLFYKGKNRKWYDYIGVVIIAIIVVWLVNRFL
jgi:hypothetical protein